MADDVDFATELNAAHLEKSISAARAPVPAGEPGECDECGEDMPRLVHGRCGFCRDGRRPPASWYEARDAEAKEATCTKCGGTHVQLRNDAGCGGPPLLSKPYPHQMMG